MVPLTIQLAKNIENFNYWRFSVVLNEISNTIGKLCAYIYIYIYIYIYQSVQWYPQLTDVFYLARHESVTNCLNSSTFSKSICDSTVKTTKVIAVVETESLFPTPMPSLLKTP